MATIEKRSPADGTVLASIESPCADDVEVPAELADIDFDSALGIPGTRDVVLAYGYANTCVVRWNDGASAPAWSEQRPELRSLEPRDVLVDPDRVVGGGFERLSELDLGTGDARTRVAGDGQNLEPVAISGPSVLAITPWLSGVEQVLGWSGAEDEPTWTLDMDDAMVAGLGGSEREYFDDDLVDVLVIDGGETFIVRFDNGTGQATVERLDPTDGALASPSAAEFEPLPGYDGNVLDVLGVVEGHVVVFTDSGFAAVPLGPGESSLLDP